MLRDEGRKIHKRGAKSRKTRGPYIIFNPKAGSALKADAVVAQLQRLGPAAVRVTRKRGDAQKFAREALRKKCDYIVTAGGDGTLNEVVNGLAERDCDICIGLVPLGTGNDFARTLGLTTAIEENIDILLAKKNKAIDLVRVRSNRRRRYFVNVSAGGFSDVVGEKLTPAIRQAWGPLAYLRGAAAALPELQAYHTRIILDGQEQLAAELYNVVIANGRFVAGGLPIAPQANPSDGLLDVVLIPTHPAAKIALLAAEILLGKHVTGSAVWFRRAKKISVRSRPRMWFNVDGEPVGTVPAVFEVVPRALNFVVGNDE
jgi:diacylglycerol kinase (ATP)